MKPFTVLAPTASADGYGYSAEALILAAVRHHGADIALAGYDWVDERYTDPDLVALKIPQEQAADRGVLVDYFLPYALMRFRSRETLCMTMWETDRLPETWAALIDQFADGVIVPSEHSAQLVRDRVDTPVRVTPFGTDISLNAYVDRDPDGPCVFLMAGMLHYRKGVEFALRAFREEFSAGEPASLVLKTRLHFLDPGSEAATLSDPRVEVIRDDYTRTEMAALYGRASCLLAPSRGEGSGLTPRDAMATGAPVVVTDWGGLTEIADPRYTWPIPIDGLEPAPMENTSYGRGVTGGGPIGNFARPSVPHLRAAMRDIYENREAAFARGRAAAAWARERWTWERCAADWLAAISDLTGGAA